ncbi:TPA: restriction endonuclease subunit S [Enterobacter cloacae]|nr:restriction endonuclease subunit S [Enterobacter cloacae]HDC4684638.1 restriction endonuclease subunit S [Enterobacter cloacae]
MMLPKLRFRGFKEQWELTLLGDVTSKIGSGSTPKGGSEVYQSTGIPFIRSQNVNDNQLKLNDLAYISHEIDEKMKGSRVEPNDILLNITGASIGRSCVVPQDFSKGNVNQHVCIIRLARGVPKFYQTYLSSQKGQNLINSSQSGSGREGLNFENIRNFKIYACSKAEQLKIADFLSSVDRKINLLNKQYELLGQYKKGIIQKIFNQKLRFKDDSGRAFPEWKSTILDEVVDLITNGLALDQNDSKNGYPVSRIETISERCINMKKVGFVDTDNDISNYKLNYGDMLFSNINSISHIGKIAYFDIDDTLYHGMNLLRIVIKNSHCKLFFYYQLITDTNKKYFESRANQAVSQASINQTELRKTPVQVPCKEEQTKIANFLSALDNKIAVKKAELDKLKTWKQGLLQQMFI